MTVPSEILKTISQNSSFIAHAHLSPDADSIGSTLALKLGLESIGKLVTIYCEDEIPEFASILPHVNQFEHADLNQILKTAPADAYISLDSAKWALITSVTPIPEFKIPLVNIDHHPDNSLKIKQTWLDPSSSSTAEMVFYLLTELEVEITKEIATCLLFGILGDTGAFQNLNTDPNSLRIAALLIDKGADYATPLVQLTRSHPYNDLKVWGTLLSNLKISTDSSYVYTTLSFEEIESLGGHTPSLGLFANVIIGRVDGTKFGAVMIEKKNGITKGGIRARHLDVDVKELAGLLGGGGHRAAAGFKISKTLKEAERDFLNAVEFLQKQGKI